MEIFDNMKKYWKGKNPDGLDMFEVPIKADEDGMIGRECPSEECQPGYFKLFIPESSEEHTKIEEHENAKDLLHIDLFCPYCGHEGNIQEFHTQQQADWIKSMLERDIYKSIQDTFKKSLVSNRTGRGSPISIEFKPGRLPNVRQYVEEKLKRDVECNKCSQKYAVYGIAFYCPFCGGGNILVHFKRSKQILLTLLEAGDVIKVKGGEEALHHHMGNCLEDVVSIFEGFHKSLYIRSVNKRYPKNEAEAKINRIKTNFQRLSGAEDFFRMDLQIEIFDCLSDNERNILEELFLKRHVITHNLGLVDDKYQIKASNWQRMGEELRIERLEIEKGLEFVNRVISEESKALGLTE
ncbi:MAG: hypothetical protein ABIN18_11635 [Pseudomonadota bacterium]